MRIYENFLIKEIYNFVNITKNCPLNANVESIKRYVQVNFSIRQDCTRLTL